MRDNMPTGSAPVDSARKPGRTSCRSGTGTLCCLYMDAEYAFKQNGAGAYTIELLDDGRLEELRIPFEIADRGLRQVILRRCSKLRGLEIRDSQTLTSDLIYHIVLDDVAISEVPGWLLRDTSSLTSLEICNCSISRLPADITFNFASLTCLQLDNAGLRALASDLFASASKLQEVSLQRNLIRSVPDGLGRSQDSLVHLNVSDNPNLERLPADVGRLKWLRSLRLDRCTNVRSLPAGLSGCAALQSLTAVEAGLQHVPVDDLARLTNLTDLALEGCPLMMHREAGGVPAPPGDGVSVAGGTLPGSEASGARAQHTIPGTETGAGSGTAAAAPTWLDPVKSVEQAQAFAYTMGHDQVRADGAAPSLARAGKLGFVLGEGSLRGSVEHLPSTTGVGGGVTYGGGSISAVGGAIVRGESHMPSLEGGAVGITGASQSTMAGTVSWTDPSTDAVIGEGLAHGLLRAKEHPGGAVAALWSVDSVRRAGFGLDEAQQQVLEETRKRASSVGSGPVGGIEGAVEGVTIQDSHKHVKAYGDSRGNAVPQQGADSHCQYHELQAGSVLTVGSDVRSAAEAMKRLSGGGEEVNPRVGST